MRFSHALLALDLSASSDDLVHAMPDVRDLGVKKVTLLTIVTKPYPDGHEKYERSSYESRLKNYAQELEQAGIECEWKLMSEEGGYTPVLILNEIQELGCDLLIIGNRGHNYISDVLLGSVASEVIQRTHVPVLLLRISKKPEFGGVSIAADLTKSILVPTDFSENADQVLDLFKADQFQNSHITVLNVQTMPKPGKQDKLDVRVKILKDFGINAVQSETKHGNIWVEITEYADKNSISLIVMGSQGKGQLEELFIGSNSLRVARYTRKPLLLIPSDN